MPVAAGLTLASKNWVYPLPIAWGLAAVWVAEQTDRPMVALLAAAANEPLTELVGVDAADITAQQWPV